MNERKPEPSVGPAAPVPPPFSLHLHRAGKKFGRDWIFRGLDLTLATGESWVLTGPNGSGKSTLLQTLAAAQPLTEGRMTYHWQGKALSATAGFRHLSLAAPYLELIEEFTLAESLALQRRFKPFRHGMTDADVLARLGLEQHRHKEVRHFSSGMKGRLKLALALFAATPLLLLDEPTTNLDAAGVVWYRDQLLACLDGRLLVLASNQPAEYDFLPYRQLALVKPNDLSAGSAPVGL